MIWILVAIVVVALVAFFLTNTRSLLAEFIGIFMGIGAGCAALAYVFLSWSWFASEHKANIINREYNTKYTQEEIFYASSVIDTIRELDRRRVEVNGDILRGKKDK